MNEIPSESWPDAAPPPPRPRRRLQAAIIRVRPQRVPTLWIYVVLLAILVPSLFITVSPRITRVRNVILLVADGLGPAELAAARIYLHGGESNRLPLEALPVRGAAMTCYGTGVIASATQAARALWAGETWQERTGTAAAAVPSMTRETLLASARRRGMATALITTLDYREPVIRTFSADALTRSPAPDAIETLAFRGHWTIFFSGGRYWAPVAALAGEEPLPPAVAAAAARGYRLLFHNGDLRNLPLSAPVRLLGLFAPGDFFYALDVRNTPGPAGNEGSAQQAAIHQPSLADLAQVALDTIGDASMGFLVLVHSGLIAQAAAEHTQDLNGDGVADAGDARIALMRLCEEVLAVDEAVGRVRRWLGRRRDTLLVVTGMREVGGLVIMGMEAGERRDPMYRGAIPIGQWMGTQPAAVDIPVWAAGPGAVEFGGTLTLDRIFRSIRGLLDTGGETT